jgi:hypothetical protein
MKSIACPLVAIICLLSSPAIANTDGIVSKDEKVYGKSLGEYASLWWQWASSMPASESPVKDMTGSKCELNQNGQVWFLAGGYGSSKITRTCSIPKDNYVFFPVINMVSFPSPSKRLTCDGAKASVAMNNDNLRAFAVTIDGYKIVNPVFHRYSSPTCFDLLAWQSKNKSSLSLYPAATDGYWVMLKPMALGKHIIKFRAEYDNPDHRYGLMVQAIEYQIEIIETSKNPPQLDLIEDNRRTVQNPGI